MLLSTMTDWKETVGGSDSLLLLTQTGMHGCPFKVPCKSCTFKIKKVGKSYFGQSKLTFSLITKYEYYWKTASRILLVYKHIKKYCIGF